MVIGVKKRLIVVLFQKKEGKFMKAKQHTSMLVLFLLFCLAGSSLVASDAGSCDSCNDSPCCTSPCARGPIHSFFKPRQITPNNMFQHNLSLYWWYHNIRCEDDCAWFTAQASVFYQRSVNEHVIARYFLPCGKETVSVKEEGNGDIGSPWLNLIAAPGQNFNATFTIRPRRSVIGAYFNFRFDLSRWLCNTWFNVAFAAMRSKHDLIYCEQKSQSPGTACSVTSVCQALTQSDWQWGKFSQCPIRRSGIDDVQLKLGYDWFWCECNHLSPYIVGTIPTGDPSCPDFIFEPTVGSKHGSVGVGFIGDMNILECEDTEITILTDFKFRYVLKKCEKRSFDLCKNGDWSRYLQVVTKDERSNSMPGINLFTRDVEVTPRSTVDWWLALHIERGPMNLEVGYDFWWRQAEKITLCDFPAGWGIYDLCGDCEMNPVSASCAAICQSISISRANCPKSDPEFVEIKCEDLNLASGATPRAISNSVYGALGWTGCMCNFPVLAGVGGSYEFGKGSSALDNFAIWFKLGMAY